MPLVGFGLWKVENDKAADLVQTAIKAGVRLFDGAADYGNEPGVGDGLKAAIDRKLVKREELFITSKLWNTFHAKEHVKEAAKRSLADLKLDYFDLYLIHFPIAQKYVDPKVRYPPGFLDEKNQQAVGANIPLAETWAAMEELVDEGLAKSIGVSNFQGSLLMDLLRSARISPAVLQIEHHPYLVQSELLSLCALHKIAVTAYFSFGPTSYVELTRVMAAQQKQQDTLFDASTFNAAGERAKTAPSLLENDVITAIAKEHDRTPAQVLLRWATQRGVAVIPKSSNETRLRQNLECGSFDLTQAELRRISALDMGLRFNNPSDMVKEFCIFA